MLFFSLSFTTLVSKRAGVPPPLDTPSLAKVAEYGKRARINVLASINVLSLLDKPFLYYSWSRIKNLFCVMDETKI